MTPICTSEVATTLAQRSAWPLAAVTAICCATAGYLLAADAPRASGPQISASWKLLGNSPNAHFDSELTLRNEGTVTLSGDWSLYFNSAAKLELGPANSEFDLTHINGDFYMLRPQPDAKPFRLGDRRVIALRGSPWAIDISDAPSGFYVVPGKDEKVAEPVKVPLRVEPFPNVCRGYWLTRLAQMIASSWIAVDLQQQAVLPAGWLNRFALQQFAGAV